MDSAEARASVTGYVEGQTYYYTLDHIGRPFNLRNQDQKLRWYEHHYAFGDVISEKTVGETMYAGAGAEAITWKPDFKFPGQYAETDMYPFTQNHYRKLGTATRKWESGESGDSHRFVPIGIAENLKTPFEFSV